MKQTKQEKIQKKEKKEQKIEREHIDAFYMRRAIDLAQKAYPAPNPQVGAVLVRDKQIIGEGYHHTLGEPHAEIVALRDAEKRGILPDGATAYITLEPCCHMGKTPPCVDSLVVSGVKRVVIGCVDQNPLVHGAGVTALLHAGITVNIGILGKECSQLYKYFFHSQKCKRPYVTLKSALTLDGKIAIHPKEKMIISSQESRFRSHELRRDHDGILVGIGTIIADNPHLNCRIQCTKQPIPIILDSSLRIPLTARVLQNSKTIVATTQRADKKKLDLLRKNGFRIIITKGKEVDISTLLEKLLSHGILSLLIEGGAHVNAAFVEAHAVDHLCFFIAPKIFGNGIPVFAAKNVFDKSESQLRNVTYKQIGNDICVEGDLEPIPGVGQNSASRRCRGCAIRM